jgi:tetratricopeptide (TPR) repeat protein
MAAASACAPAVVPAPVVLTPRFPDLIKPAVPAALQNDLAVTPFNRAWQFLQSGDLDTADRELSLALRASPAFYPAETVAGYVAVIRKDAQTALTHFDRALAEQRAEPAALVGRGEALLALDREPDAIASFEAAVAADPSLTAVRRRIEVLKFRGVERDIAAARAAASANNNDEAIRAYRSAIASSPDSAFLYRELAAIERRIGDPYKALEELNRAVALDPADANSFTQIGELLEERGEFDAAAKAYNQALALEPSGAVEGKLAALRERAELARLPEPYRAIEDLAQVTRGDLAALIGVRLDPVLKTIPARDPGVITDVRTHWAEPWILAVAGTGVMEPFANHTFQPAIPVRRIDLADAVSHLLAAVATRAEIDRWGRDRPNFPDLASSHLSYPAASIAIASGIMRVGTDGAFDPSGPVSGRDAAAAVERLRTWRTDAR